MHQDETLLLMALRSAAFELIKMEGVTSVTADFCDGVRCFDFDLGDDRPYSFELEEGTPGELPSIELTPDLYDALFLSAIAMSTVEGITSAELDEDSGTVAVTVRGGRSYVLRQREIPELQNDAPNGPDC
jgi:hypothetical protein